MAASSGQKVNNSKDELPRDIWMIRPCEFYKEEYHDCKSLRGRFHHYYIYGSLEDCSLWKSDLDNCVIFTNTNSADAAEKVLVHERMRKKERQAGAAGNDVWEYRTSPPQGWNQPLEEWTKQRENTVLGQISQTGITSPDKKTDSSSCVIL